MNKIILLVDDDCAFRASVRDILEIEGYKVIEIEDGKYAIPIIEKDHIDLVITDLLMPEFDGLSLAFEIKELKPDLKVIGMTGGGRIGSADNVTRMCPPFVFEAVLNKPFLGEDLIIQVAAALS